MAKDEICSSRISVHTSFCLLADGPFKSVISRTTPRFSSFVEFGGSVKDTPKVLPRAILRTQHSVATLLSETIRIVHTGIQQQYRKVFASTLLRSIFTHTQRNFGHTVCHRPCAVNHQASYLSHLVNDWHYLISGAATNANSSQVCQRHDELFTKPCHLFSSFDQHLKPQETVSHTNSTV